MINKQKFLGKNPLEAGLKDAVHVAIVSVRADGPLEPGEKAKINKHGEAECLKWNDKKHDGIIDPFMKNGVVAGQFCWMMIDPSEIGEVAHVWSHKKHSFEAPTREVRLNTYIKGYADDLGLTYNQLFEAMNSFVKEKSVKYEGTLNEEDLEEALENIDRYDLWSEWAGETGHEFENIGSMCCPEYDYPSICF